jgi:acyl-CoA dehydrogenase
MVPEAYGGAGQGMTEMLLFMEGLANNGIPLLNLVVGPTMTMGLLAKHASEDHEAPLSAGRLHRRDQVLLRHHRTQRRLELDRDHQHRQVRRQGRLPLNGQKVFITDANRSDYAMVVTRTTPRADVKKKSDGFTIFMVDMKKKGISMTLIPVAFPVPETQWQVFFDDVALTEDDVLGEVGQGLRHPVRHAQPRAHHPVGSVQWHRPLRTEEGGGLCQRAQAVQQDTPSAPTRACSTRWRSRAARSKWPR